MSSLPAMGEPSGIALRLLVSQREQQISRFSKKPKKLFYQNVTWLLIRPPF